LTSAVGQLKDIGRFFEKTVSAFFDAIIDTAFVLNALELQLNAT